RAAWYLSRVVDEHVAIDDFAYQIANDPSMSAAMGRRDRSMFCLFRPPWVVCHERSRSIRLRVTVREMKEGPSGSAIRSLIPSHRELLRSKAVVVSVAETSGQ